MKTNDLYNIWAATYDSNENKTRDLDLEVTQKLLKEYTFEHVLEIGAGTGKNTSWLARQSQQITVMDFSSEMLTKLQQKVKNVALEVIQQDISHKWPLKGEQVDLVLANLVLEHIKDLKPIFEEAARVLQPKGKFFISELHPFKQYLGSKARFEQEGKMLILESHIHHISDYIEQAKMAGLSCLHWQEWFDENDKTKPPRLISFLFEKTTS